MLWLCLHLCRGQAKHTMGLLYLGTCLSYDGIWMMHRLFPSSSDGKTDHVLCPRDIKLCIFEFQFFIVIIWCLLDYFLTYLISLFLCFWSSLINQWFYYFFSFLPKDMPLREFRLRHLISEKNEWRHWVLIIFPKSGRKVID